MLDLIVIGSGPAGLSAAVYGKRANLNLLVIEKDYEGTGQVASSSRVDNYLGLPGLDGYSMGEQFREHAASFGAEFVQGVVTDIIREDSYWKVICSSGESYDTKTIIYATGASHKKLGIPGEESLEGKGISYCATCDGAFFKNKTVAVIGGGDTALNDALYLSQLCEKVYLIHRREEFRAASSTVSKVKATDNIELILNSYIKGLSGSVCLESVQVKNLLDNQINDLYLNGLFVAVGSLPNTKIIPAEVQVDEKGYIIADETGVTSAKGFFVAGDVRTKPLRQVCTAVSDGANAVYSVENYLKELP